MGTEYWLVDREGRNALDVDKAYGLANEVADAYPDGDTLGHVVTPEMVERFDCPRGAWLRLAIQTWMRDVAKGRPVEIWDDQTDSEWQGYDDAAHRFVAQPGWTLYQTHDGVSPYTDHIRLWRPPEVANLIIDRKLWESRVHPVPPDSSAKGPGLVRWGDPDPDAWVMAASRDGEDPWMYVVSDGRRYRFPWRFALTVPEGFYLLAEEVHDG